MKIVRSLLLLLVLMAAAGASAENIAKTFEIKKPGKGLESSCGIVTTYVYDPTATTATVKVTAPKEVMQYVEVKQSNGRINLRVNENKTVNNIFKKLKYRKGIQAVVTGPLFRDIEANSGSSIECKTLLTYPAGTSVEIEVNSGASLKFAGIVCEKFECEASSGASAKIDSLKVKKTNLEANSGASLKLKGVEAGEIDAEASSGASLTISGKGDKVKFDANSGGSIHANNFTGTKMTWKKGW